MRILARPPVMASKQALRVLARAAQAHMAARASSQVAKNKQPKSNLTHHNAIKFRKKF